MTTFQAKPLQLVIMLPDFSVRVEFCGGASLGCTKGMTKLMAKTFDMPGYIVTEWHGLSASVKS